MEEGVESTKLFQASFENGSSSRVHCRSVPVLRRAVNPDYCIVLALGLDGLKCLHSTKESY